MKISFGGKTTDVHGALTQAGDEVLAVVRAVERRIREWPAGPSQDEIKDLEHLSRILTKISRVRDVRTAYRVTKREARAGTR